MNLLDIPVSSQTPQPTQQIIYVEKQSSPVTYVEVERPSTTWHVRVNLNVGGGQNNCCGGYQNYYPQYSGGYHPTYQPNPRPIIPHGGSPGVPSGNHSGSGGLSGGVHGGSPGVSSRY